ncbi:hypothetical protein [Lysobacter capsici]|nr:hypothetical protein [Lysobacter capsici]
MATAISIIAVNAAAMKRASPRSWRASSGMLAKDRRISLIAARPLIRR